MRRVSLVLGLLLLAVVPAAAGAQDFAYNILPPGQFGGLPGTPANHGTDQIPLYDALTPLRGNVTAADIAKDYKPEDFAPDRRLDGRADDAAGRRPDDPARHLRRAAHLRQDALGPPGAAPAGSRRRTARCSLRSAACRPTRRSPTSRA